MATLLPYAPALTENGQAQFGTIAPETPRTRQGLSEPARRGRAVWIGRKRHTAAAPPAEAEVTRMVAEFHARGGQITHCTPAHAVPVNNGAGREAAHWTP